MPATNHKRLPKPAEPEVLTLGEAASFLRVSAEAVLGLVSTDGFPGRQIGGEWRFLKRGLVMWLQGGAQPAPARGSVAAVLQHAGVFRDDDDLDEQLAAVRAAREGTGR